MWNLPLRRGAIEITVPSRRRVSIDGAVVHRAVNLFMGEVRRLNGIPVTSPSRTLRDLAAVLPPEELEAVLDHALAERIVTMQALTRLSQREREDGRVPGCWRGCSRIALDCGRWKVASKRAC
jgi:hypothetical protein